jgi:hypothetical protein
MFGLLVAAGCVMTGYLIAAFMNRKPDAAFLGKHHVVINLFPALYVYSWLLDHIDNESLVTLLLIFFWGCVISWRYFFGSSSQVKALIPPATRRVGQKVKYLVIFLYVLIGIVFVLNHGLEKWWIAIFVFLGVLSLSPLGDLPSNLDEADKEEQDK